jgi:uncharacterized protein (TIGR02996 family)
MAPRPARKSFKMPLSASNVEVADSGDVFVYGHRYVIHRWESTKSAVVTGAENAEAGKLARLCGDRKLVSWSFNFTKQRDLGVIVERETGRLLHKLEPKTKIEAPREAAGSNDGKHVALSFGHINVGNESRGLDVFDATSGKHLQRVTLPELCDGMIFAEDSETLLYFSDGHLHRHVVGEKKAKRVKCNVKSWASEPRVQRKDGHLFIQWAGYGHRHAAFVVDEAKSKIVMEVPEAEASCFGPFPGTVVVSTGADVRVLDFKGKEVGAFVRDRKTRFEGAASHPEGFFLGVTAGGSFLEVFDLKQLTKIKASNPDPNKKRAPNRPPVVLKPKGTALEQGAKLREAIWKDPGDKEALRVYADWLAEQGADTQAEYLQLRLLDAPTDEQLTKAQRLREKHRGQWLGGARQYVRSWTDASEPPGFVERVWCEAQKLIPGFEHVLALGPRLTVSVTSMRTRRRDTEQKLAALPLGKLWKLDLRANDLDDTGLSTLAPAMAGLRHLNLDQNVFTAKGVQALGAHVSTLESLSMQPKLSSPQDVPDSYCQAVATTPGFEELKVLEVKGMWSVPSPSAAALKALKKARPKLEVIVGD